MKEVVFRTHLSVQVQPRSRAAKWIAAVILKATISCFLKANPHFRNMELILHPITQHQVPTMSDYSCVYSLQLWWQSYKQMKTSFFFSLLSMGLLEKGVKMLQFWWLEMMANNFSGALQTCVDIAVLVVCTLQEAFISVGIEIRLFSGFFLSALNNLRHKHEIYPYHFSNECATCPGQYPYNIWGPSWREWWF